MSKLKEILSAALQSSDLSFTMKKKMNWSQIATGSGFD